MVRTAQTALVYVVCYRMEPSVSAFQCLSGALDALVCKHCRKHPVLGCLAGIQGLNRRARIPIGQQAAGHRGCERNGVFNSLCIQLIQPCAGCRTRKRPRHSRGMKTALNHSWLRGGGNSNICLVPRGQSRQNGIIAAPYFVCQRKYGRDKMYACMPGGLLVSIIQFRAVSIHGIHKRSRTCRIFPALKKNAALFGTALRIYNSCDCAIKRRVQLIARICSSKIIQNQRMQLPYVLRGQILNRRQIVRQFFCHSHMLHSSFRHEGCSPTTSRRFHQHLTSNRHIPDDGARTAVKLSLITAEKLPRLLSFRPALCGAAITIKENALWKSPQGNPQTPTKIRRMPL